MGEISRSSEFFSVDELEKQTGQPKENFLSVVVKELLDNAIDVTESSISPEVSIDLDMDENTVRISVSDNGPGIKSKTIDRIKNFDVRVTDKLNYKSPSRGQQGNALKTILGMPYALGSKEPVVITARGVRHTIYAHPDSLGEVIPDHIKEKVTNTKGTTIALTLPRNPAALSFDARQCVRAYALSNPHVLVKIRCFDKGYLDNCNNPQLIEISDSYQPTVKVSKHWRKFMVHDLTAPSWYDADTLKRQVRTIVKNNTDRPLREFVQDFRGLTANDKAKTVCDQFPDIHHLSDFNNQEDRIAGLLAVMKATAEPPSPKVLGFIGKEHFRTKFDEWYGIKAGRFYYKRSECVVDGIPYIIEAASSEVDANRGEMFHLLNFSPTYIDPTHPSSMSDTLLTTAKVSRYGFQSFMDACYANPNAPGWEPAKRRNVAAALHIVSPGFSFLDRGKTRVSLPNDVASEVAECLWAVGKSFFEEGKRLEKDAAKEAKRREKQEREENQQDDEEDESPALKDAVYAVLPQAYALKSTNETYELSVRDLYYGVRDAIQQYTSDEIKYTYFSDLLVRYQQEYGKFRKIYYDPRGYLIEPSGRIIQLGTREVERYEFPSWEYNKILFVEKKGFIEPFIQAQIHRRYDMAIVASEGYPTEAIRNLFRNADQNTDYKLFVLHDSDPHGYNIARTLQEETARMPGYHVDVIDLGLGLQEALDMGLLTETFPRRKALPKNLIPKLSPLKLEYFTGEYTGMDGTSKRTWKAQRVELNALGPVERIAFLERKLAEHGATAKVLPPDVVLENRALRTFIEHNREKARREVERELDIDRLIDEKAAKTPTPDFSNTITAVKERLKTNPPENWAELLDDFITAIP
jgi:DNA topoisomerase VI subunit B